LQYFTILPSPFTQLLVYVGQIEILETLVVFNVGFKRRNCPSARYTVGSKFHRQWYRYIKWTFGLD
jgi:hypothetical protein